MWCSAGEAPVYIGFGSLVVDDPKGLTKTILEAAKRTGRRILLFKCAPSSVAGTSLSALLCKQACPTFPVSYIVPPVSPAPLVKAVIPHPHLSSEGACRGWGNLGEGADIPPNVHLLGNTPHDWLLPQCSGVVHHGGAGTTAAGLLAACPTTVVFFFGDQPFWGGACFRSDTRAMLQVLLGTPLSIESLGCAPRLPGVLHPSRVRSYPVRV